MLDETDAFIDQWMAHGVPLMAGRELRYDQFVLVGVDERAAGVSGCSIDALVRRMQQLERVLGLELVNNGPVLYREGESAWRVPRDRFAELAASGTVSPSTKVFDSTPHPGWRSARRQVGGEGGGPRAWQGFLLTQHW